jgi:hypothetical protein
MSKRLQMQTSGELIVGAAPPTGGGRFHRGSGRFRARPVAKFTETGCHRMFACGIIQI